VGPEEALQIAIKRGQATERVGKENPGCMASILDLKGGLPQLEELLGEVRADMGGIVDVSNVYTDKDLVISGQIPQVEEALRRLEGVRKAYKLPISFASHCGLMDEASEEFGQEIAEFEFADPQMPWIMNGELVLKGPEIKRRMVEGLKKRINVKDSFALIKERGIPVMYEMSPKAEEKSIFERYAKSVTPELVIKPR
jgi:malonyl CoA-acyl carrier protein transacylase